MDAFVTAGLFLLLVLATALPYWRRVASHKRDAEKRFDRNFRAGLAAPVTLHPHIDLLQCIGCSSCVQVCPEHVLGMVRGRAAIVNGTMCVGHALCADVCPVGAITMGFGVPVEGMEIPYTDSSCQTNIPGMYIVGELGGLGLIRNAVSQGTAAVADIARRRRRAASETYDLLIVGAGPAGLAASLAATERGMKSLVLEQEGVGGSILQYPRKKMVLTSPLELPLHGTLKGPEISKEELLEIWKSAVRRFGLNVSTGEKVASVEREGDRFTVATSRGPVAGSSVILALGRRGSPRKLGVPGEDLPKVTYRLIEAESYKNTRVLVVGGGDSAVEAAVALARQEGNIVTMSYRKGEFVRIKEKNEARVGEMMRSGKINVLFNSVVSEIRPDSVLLDQAGDGRHELPNDAVMIFAGGELPGEFLKRIGIRLRMGDADQISA